MAAVAQARIDVHRRAAAGHRRTVRRVRVRRRTRIDFRRFSRFLLCVLTLASLFGYVSIYANLTVAGYNRSKLLDMCRQERLDNQRLKLRWDALSSPNYVVSAAEKAGMVYATQYDYLDKPERLASTAGPRGR